MENSYHYFKHFPDERNIANLPWMIALSRRKAGLPSSIDNVARTTCTNRTSYKLKSIDREGRSSSETEAWNKVLDHGEIQARVRAVQMHLNCITTLKALPITYSCCEQRPFPAAAVVPQGYHTDEYEREWIYEQALPCVWLVGIILQMMKKPAHSKSQLGTS